MYDVLAFPLTWKLSIVEPDWFEGMFMLMTGYDTLSGSLDRASLSSEATSNLFALRSTFLSNSTVILPPSLKVEEEIFLIPVTVVSTPSKVVVTSCSITRMVDSGQLYEIVREGRYLVGLSCSESKGIIAAPTMISITNKMLTVKSERKVLW